MKGIACAFDARISKDAALKSTNAGREFMTLSVIEGEGEDEQWISVSAWSDHLRDLAPCLKAGVEVYVQGKLKMTRWETAEGSRHGLRVSADVIQPKALIGERKPKAPRGGKKAKADPQRPLETGEAGRPFDDSLPF